MCVCETEELYICPPVIDEVRVSTELIKQCLVRIPSSLVR